MSASGCDIQFSTFVTEKIILRNVSKKVQAMREVVKALQVYHLQGSPADSEELYLSSAALSHYIDSIYQDLFCNETSNDNRIIQGTFDSCRITECISYFVDLLDAVIQQADKNKHLPFPCCRVQLMNVLNETILNNVEIEMQNATRNVPQEQAVNQARLDLKEISVSNPANPGQIFYKRAYARATLERYHLSQRFLAEKAIITTAQSEWKKLAYQVRQTVIPEVIIKYIYNRYDEKHVPAEERTSGSAYKRAK